MEAVFSKEKKNKREFSTTKDGDECCTLQSLSSNLLQDVQPKKELGLHWIRRTRNTLMEFAISHFILSEQIEQICEILI
jgi:hypothetical protein